jgi:hypothetical protein
MKKPAFNRVFRRFVQLVTEIPEVAHVVGFEDQARDIFTFTQVLDDRVALRVFECQDMLLTEFGEPFVDFHITWLNGQQLTDFVNPLPPLFYSREVEVARKK